MNLRIRFIIRYKNPRQKIILRLVLYSEKKKPIKFHNSIQPSIRVLGNTLRTPDTYIVYV